MQPDPDDGAYESMDQVGQWVRYADAKAGLVAAGFAGVLTIVAGQADNITEAVHLGSGWAVACIALSAAATIASGVTLWSLIQALAPRPRSSSLAPNRFAWPALAAMDETALRTHVSATSPRDDAWGQTKQLADIAKEKYAAIKVALVGFLFMTVFGVAAVVLAGIASGLAKTA